MTTQIRTGLVDPNNVSDESRCKLLCADNSEITYWYDDENNKLYLHEHASGSDYVLCENVTAMTFKKDDITPTGDVKSVRISMTVENGDLQQIFSAAAIVRKVIK